MRKVNDTERIEHIDFHIDSGTTLQGVQEQFDAFVERYNVFPETVHIDRDVDYDNEDAFYLVGIREETPAEKNRRLAAERQRRIKAGERQKAKLEQERKEYERLKKKFG